MSDAPNQDRPRKGAFARFLDVIEWLGNLLPHPVTLFALFAFGTALISAVAAHYGMTVDHPNPGPEDPASFQATSLMNTEGLRWLGTHLVTNFTGFAPLGTVLVAMLGVGIAERSGLLSAAIRGLVLGAPSTLLTAAIVFAGVLSNTASEMGYVVLIPLAAVVFHSVGRNPLVGLAAAFAGVSGGYSANLLIGTVDPLLAGITTEAAEMINADYAKGGLKEVSATANWYFMAVSTFLITIVGTFVTTRIVEPKLGAYDDSNADKEALGSKDSSELTQIEKRGLKVAALASLGFVGLICFLAVPSWGWMRDPNYNESVIQDLRPLLKSVVALIFVGFGLVGFAYGRVVGTIRNDRDVIDAMGKAMGTMGLYLVLVFFAAQMVEIFKYTQLGPIVAVHGSDWLNRMEMNGPGIFIPFILMCCFVNLMIGSASAQWSMTAPIFVPMLMRVGYSPEVIQAAYRIGDSTTNTITPMMSYFGLILAFAHRYDKNLGIGTLVATMLPYSICFLLGWVALFYLWVFGLGLPVGPGVVTRIPI
ncbi:MAG: AbgT family transporter [Planctomycetota bacterium]|nr:AbgT family transporter [Planctomycetota bacterium]